MCPVMFSTDPRTKEYDVCFCSAYKWPHAVGFGICKEYCKELCEFCHRPALDIKEIDDGIGPYEFWGARGTDHRWVEVTTCCEAGWIPNDIEALKHRKLNWRTFDV